MQVTTHCAKGKQEDDIWICDFCAEEFNDEVDLLAHQFNSSCEPKQEKP